MRIVFCANECIPIHAKLVDQRPLGGTETGTIKLAKALHDLGHQVTVLTRMDNPPLSQPLYLPITALNQLGEKDVLISIRDWKPLFLPIKAKYKFLWTGDAYDQPSTVGIGDRRIANQMAALLCVSNWHADTLCKQSGFPREQALVIRNGVDLSYFEGHEERVRKRLIYSSTPYRGLVYLLEIFPRILEKHPDAELHIFSGYDVYAGVERYPENVYQEFNVMIERFRQIPNIYIRGNVPQKSLAREFMKAAVLAYPNTFEETSCITAMEAQSAGCAIVSSKRGALVETVGENGFLFDGKPGTLSYDQQFIDAIDRLLSDDNFFAEVSRRGRERAAHELGWKHVAERLLQFLRERFGLG